jgi:hypothetical protein
MVRGTFEAENTLHCTSHFVNGIGGNIFTDHVTTTSTKEVTSEK